MNFDFSPEQKAFQQQVHRLLAKACTPELVREVAEGRQPYAVDLWARLAELGALGPHLAEEYAGAGQSHVELCLVAEAMGYALAPAPFFSTICIVAESIRLGGSVKQRAELLPLFATGARIACASLIPGRGATAPDARLRLVDGRLHGTARAIPDGAIADMALLLLDGPSSGNGGMIVLADLGGPGVERKPVESIDLLQGRADLSFEGTSVEVLGQIGGGDEIAAQVMERAGIMLAFEKLGGARRCLEMAREYALVRKAFGRPIGSFQALKHKLVDVYARLRLAEGHARYAAWALATQAPDLRLAAAAAHVAATEAFSFAAQENIQVHGGVGFTWEHDCHLLYRRARALALDFGSVREARERIADLITAE